MDTAILAVLLLASLIILRMAARMARTDSERRVRRYYSDTAQRAAQRGGDLETDALHIWRLQSSGQAASRRAVVRRGEMTHGRWNRASAVMAHLNLDPAHTRYDTGAAMIQEYIREQQRLAKRTTFVPPYA